MAANRLSSFPFCQMRFLIGEITSTVFLDSSFARRIDMTTARSGNLQNLQTGERSYVLLASLSVRLFRLLFSLLILGFKRT